MPMTPDTPRMSALKQLSQNLPVANSRIAQGQAAARDMQVQSAVARQPVAAPITQTAQQTGAAAAQQTGAQMVQGAQQGIQQQGQVAQVGLQQAGQAADARVAGSQMSAAEQKMDNVERLAALDESAKQELFDANMQFQRDESGRALFNETQLADYARLKAGSDEEFKKYAQDAEQSTQRNLQAMETAYRIVNADMEQQYAEAKQRGDQEMMQRVQKAKQEAEARMKKEKARAANKQAMWSAGAGVAGGAAGAVFGGPTGAMVGAQAGSAIGGLIGNNVG